MGQMVRTLVSREQPGGFYTVEWEGRNDRGIPVSAGVYVYALKTNNFIKIRKMVLLR